MCGRSIRMPRVPTVLLLAAAPPIAASMVVLALAGVNRSIWNVHFAAIVLALLLAIVGGRALRGVPAAVVAPAVFLLTFAGLAVPLLRGGAVPVRWLACGGMQLYMAPVCLPVFLTVCSREIGAAGRRRGIAFAALVVVSGLLAAQPDAAQMLALLAAAAVVFVRERAPRVPATALAVAMAAATAWSFTRPDPLAPVPYVEGVFALALGHSSVVGIAVIAGAAALVLGLWTCARRGVAGPAAVAAYYAVLFACSVAGITPAPLVGYGAGPLLGFGLLAAMSTQDPHRSRS